MEHRFRLLNVFTVEGARLSGNPLCVFEDGRGLTDAQMQALARQFNLSETTFLLPETTSEAAAQVRIFTPTWEMPFAGHPTLGSAHVVRDLRGAGDSFALEMKVGLVRVQAAGDRWRLRAAKAPETRAPAPRADLAAMLGLPEAALGERPLWVDTGAEQLVIPLRAPADVARCRPDAGLLARHGYSEKRGATMAYVFAPTGPGEVAARFFFLVDGGLVEDPATGSACANLGGWHLATGAPLPVDLRVAQGAEIRRPSRLHLRVEPDGGVYVGGEVIELGRGALRLD